jgi:hypothetical protein
MCDGLLFVDVELRDAVVVNFSGGAGSSRRRQRIQLGG